MQSPLPFYLFKGMPLLEINCPRSRVEAVERYTDVRGDDVFVCTYPKAGTHWVADLAHKILYDGDLRQAKDQFTEAYLENTPAENGSNTGPLGYMPRTLEELSALPSPRVIRTHLHISMLPHLVLSGTAKVIYVQRDPRDMAASFYPYAVHETKRLGAELPMTWDEYLEYFNSGRVPYGAWYDHFKDFQENITRPNVLGLKYESMKQDLPGTVATIATFLERSLTDDTLKRIVESCSFESLKAEYPHTPLFRKGVCGDWKNCFTVSQSERMAAEFQLVRAELGLVMDYE